MPDSIQLRIGLAPLTAIIAFSLGFCSPTAHAADLPPARGITYTAPVDATIQSVAAILTQQSGLPIELRDIRPDQPCKIEWVRTPLWQALQELADRADARLEFADSGKTVIFRKRGEHPLVPAAIVGPFRIGAKAVRGRLDLDSGLGSHELDLEVRWEPGIRVYRMDAYPKIVTANDDRERKLTAPSVHVRSAVSGNVAISTVRWEALSREARTIALLSAEVQATVAEQLLVFRFPVLGEGSELSQAGVKAAHTLTQRGSGWLLEVTLDYGAALPEFESFENWMIENTAELISPTGKAFALSDPEIRILPKGRYSIRYRFTDDPATKFTPSERKGWSLGYVTPSTLREVTIPFTLKGIPLP